MKPLAILKDSLREAWDSKTLLVMLALAMLFIVGVASIGYDNAKPRDVIERHYSDEDMSRPHIRLQRGKLDVPFTSPGSREQYPYPVFSVTSFQTTKEGSHPSQGEHTFTVLIRRSDAVDAEKAKEKDGKKDEKKDEKKAREPGADVDIFERMVAVWHDVDNVGSINREDLDPRKWILRKPVTEEMVREYLEAELVFESQLPIAAIERLPAPNPGERVYKITTGPSTEPRAWPVKMTIFFGAFTLPFTSPLGVAVYRIQENVISSIGGLIIILIAVIVTSFFIPNMLRPGAVVMLLSKPLSRTTLLLFKYFGGLFFVLILSAFLVTGVWIITGIRSGIWAPGVFVIIPLMTLSFAILYAFSTVIAVISRNSIVCILATLVFAGFLWAVGKADLLAGQIQRAEDTVAALKKDDPQYPTWTKWAKGINQSLPRWRDLDVLSGESVYSSLLTLKQQEEMEAGQKKHLPSWGGTIGVTLLWIAGMLGFACWRFSTKDY